MNRIQCDLMIEFVNGEVSPSGYRCIEVEWDAAGRILRIFLENSTYGLDMEDCVKVTKLLSENERLDALVSGPYTLEVSSPGIERPLRDLADFSRYLGQSVEVKLLNAVDARKHGKGKIVEVLQESSLPLQAKERADCGAESPTITIETSRGLWKFPFKALLRANLVYDWGQTV